MCVAGCWHVMAWLKPRAMSENPFRRKMEEKNEAQLRHVLGNSDQFRPLAVEAAREVLQERKDQVQESDFEEPEPEKSDSIRVVIPKDAVVPEIEKINPRYSLRAIATYQILGSLFILPSIFGLYPQVMDNIRNLVILVFFTLLYLAGIFSAYLIFKKRYEGLMAALVFNLFQSFYIQIGTVTFFSTGIFSVIYYFPAGLNFSIANPSFLLNLGSEGGFILGFNLIACTAFSFLMSAIIAFDDRGEFPEHLY